jgi:hypothetical protein
MDTRPHNVRMFAKCLLLCTTKDYWDNAFFEGELPWAIHTDPPTCAGAGGSSPTGRRGTGCKRYICHAQVLNVCTDECLDNYICHAHRY